MLHHQSGLPDYVGLLEDAGFGYQDRTTTQDALDVLVDGPGLDFEPGTSWAYANTGYFLLGVAVAVTCNRPDLPASGPALLDLWTRALT